MSRIAQTIGRNRQKKSKTLVGFLVAGDPNLRETVALAHTLAEAGVDILELGVPFSDPLADGPTIQRAAERALASGTTLKGVLQAARQIRDLLPDLPMVLFSYANPIFALGYGDFAAQAAAAGVDGALVVDLPPEEAGDYLTAMAQHSLDPIFLASPTTDHERLRWLDQKTRGFLYYVARTGVTGGAGPLSQTLAEEMAVVRREVQSPVMIGFGIATPEAARTAAALGDGVVVGSAIVDLIAQTTEEAARRQRLGQFVREIKTAIQGI